MRKPALVDQALCYHEDWVTTTTLSDPLERLECTRCGYTLVESRALEGDLVQAVPERPNPLKLSRTVGSSGVAGPA